MVVLAAKRHHGREHGARQSCRLGAPWRTSSLKRGDGAGIRVRDTSWSRNERGLCETGAATGPDER